MQTIARIMFLGMLIVPLTLTGCCGAHHGHKHKCCNDKVTDKMQQEYGSK